MNTEKRSDCVSIWGERRHRNVFILNWGLIGASRGSSQNAHLLKVRQLVLQGRSRFDRWNEGWPADLNDAENPFIF